MRSWWLNVVLCVEADGERLVLRRYGVTPPEEVRWELAVVDHLRKNGFPTIAPLLRSDVAHDALGELQEKPAVLYPFVEGQRGCDLDWSFAVGETAHAIAWLHALTEGLAVPHPRVRSGTESRRIIRKLLNHTAERGVAADETPLLDLVERTEHAIKDFEARIAPYAEGLPRGVVHHDAHCENVLFRDDRLVALIDFDDAYEGYLVADVAVMITNWARDRSAGDRLDLAKAGLVVREYERHRRLTKPERELLPDFVLMYLLCDTAEYVCGRLERGADGNTAVGDCEVYKLYLHHVDHAEWSAAIRRAVGEASD